MLACGCDEYPEVWSPRWQKARKEYKCCECGHMIQPGEEYWRVFTVWEGSSYNYQSCEPCADLGEAFTDIGYCLGMGCLFEDYAEWLEIEGADPERASVIRRKHRAGQTIYGVTP